MVERKVNLAIIGDLAYDQTITPKGNKKSLAGAVYNVAVAASTISNSETVGVVARVGDDFQDGISALIQRGVNVEGIHVLIGGKTAIFTITQREDNTRELSADLGVSEKVDTTIFPDSYKTAHYVHLASSNPEKYLKWIPYLRKILSRDVVLSADANDLFIQNGIDATVAALSAVDLAFINEIELAAIKVMYPDFQISKPTILKKGPKGATYIDNQEGIIFTIEAPNVKVVDTSGAGDTLAGIFLASLSRGIRVQDALKAGVEMASKTVTDFGVEHINPLKS